jgi:hypothetical protein
MTLDEIGSGRPEVSLSLVGRDEVLAGQVQGRQGVHGGLAPPADGSFGPVSLWAMAQFLRNARGVQRAARMAVAGAASLIALIEPLSLPRGGAIA